MKSDSKFSNGDADAEERGKYQALPKGWQCVKLGDIATIRKEKFIITANNNHLPCIELEHIEKHSGKIIATASVANKLSIKNTFYAGDVLYGKLRPNLRKYAFPQFKGVCASEIWVFKANTDFCLNKFLFYTIQSEKFTEVACRTTGTKMPRADWSLLRNFSIFIPNKNTQNKIVSILETWDTAIEKTERLIAAKEKHFKWLLKTLISDQQNNPDWKKINLGDILRYEQPTKYIVRTTNYKNSGNIAVLTANKSFILGYTDERDNIFDKEDVIIFDDFTTDKKYVNFPFKVKSSALKILKSKDAKINLFFLFHVMNLIKLPLGGHKRYWIAEYQHIAIKLPPLKDQEKLAKILHTAKQEITTLQNLAEKYRTQKRGLMQKLLTEKTKGKN